jgi:negative regulator of sigma E activity
MTRKTSDELRDHSRTLDDIAISFRMLADELDKRNVDVLYADGLEDISRSVNTLMQARSKVEKAIREGAY